MGPASQSVRFDFGRRARWVVLIAILVIGFSQLPVVTGSLGAARAAQFEPTDDSYVDGNREDANFGSRNSLRIDGSPSRVAYLRFDVQGSEAGASAVLQVNVESSGDDIVLHTVADTSWDEETLTFTTAPPLGAVVETATEITGGSTYYFDVSSIVTGDGVYAFGVSTTDNTAIKIGSKEGGNAAQLLIPAPASSSPFFVTRAGTEYTATSLTNSTTFTGTLKYAVESAVSDLRLHGGGEVIFDAGTFDLGADHFELDNIENVAFEGQGMGLTLISNSSNDADDTEPFDVVGADNLVLRDMAIAANGSPRSTSDALDFDNGSNITIERVHITASRGRGIVFDGKGDGWSADGNVLVDCVIDGIPGDGIELLASSQNTISGCTITDVGGHGIQVNKASATADQPNKKSNDNLIVGNTIDDSGRDGINVNSSDRNRIIDNLVMNNSDDTTNRDGIRLDSNSGITCDDNEVEGNTATDTQAIKTQRYGINISSAECHRTVIGPNDLAGNKTGELNDLGTDTQYDLPPDTQAPSVPTGVVADAPSHFEVQVTWDASTDDAGVAGYTVYRDGSPIASVGGSTLSFLDDSVAASTTYQYQVDAFDAAGNVSDLSTPPAEVTTPAVSGSITVNPADDAYVDASAPTRNYGSSSALRIDGSPERNAYVKFDVAGTTGTVVSATLRVYAATGSSVGFNAHPVADTTWTEDTITFSSAPPIGAVIGSSGPMSGGAYIEFDVTGIVTGDGLVSFAITTDHSTAIRFDSSEGGNAPELVVTLGT